MADEPIRFQFTYDGRDFDFEPTQGEIEELEEEFDKPLSEINFERSKAIRLIVMFGLRRHQRNRPTVDIMAEINALSASEWTRRLTPPEPAGDDKPRPTKAKAAAAKAA